MAGHSRPKDGVASVAYVPAIHVLAQKQVRRGCPGHDGLNGPRNKQGTKWT